MATLSDAVGSPETNAADVVSRSFYSVSQAAELLGVSRVSIWRWVRDGHLPVVRLGHRTVRIKRDDLESLPLRLGHSGSRSRVREIGTEQSLASAVSPPSDDHFVQFYDSDEFLVEAVGAFIGQSLRAGDAGVVVATSRHLAGLEDVLAAQALDLAAARASGRYVSMDADATLACFMADGQPDAARFEEVIGSTIVDAAAGKRRVRIYGEMVAVLAAAGNYPATIRLEQLWNALRKIHSFSLLCGYPMDRFGGAAMAGLLGDVCGEHSQVVPTESYTALVDQDRRLRAVAVLQQQAQSLHAEIVERKRAEERLRDALIAERLAREAAEAALRSRDEFLATASHELRTPITVLSGQAQLALRRLARDGQVEPERVVRTLQGITGQADKLARLVSQLLDLSRIEGGKLRLEIEQTDLVALAEQVVRNAREWTDRHPISVSGPASLEARVDPLRLEQVLANLLDNAIKYSPDGGEIEVRLASRLDGSVELSVRDRGLGIPPEQRDQIFERFHQAHGTGYRSGMGLGLHICRQIVELHGGTIQAEFPPDGGTRLSVQLKPSSQPA